MEGKPGVKKYTLRDCSRFDGMGGDFETFRKAATLILRHRKLESHRFGNVDQVWGLDITSFEYLSPCGEQPWAWL